MNEKAVDHRCGRDGQCVCADGMRWKLWCKECGACPVCGVLQRGERRLVRPGGKLVLVGNIAQPTSVRFMEFSEREIDIISVFRYRNKFPMAISAVSSGRIPVRSIATDVFAFQQTQEAFEHALHEKQSVLKAIVAL